MARDKLITIRIESEKREAFKELAKSQNTDTASLLYDFISQCLDGRIDIGIVTGKGNRIDKIDNQIGSDRIDKLEATTQEIGERVGSIAKKLNDWVEAFDSRLNDCEKGLSNKITSLEHRLNALSIQLDSQGENPDMGTVATVETADSVETVDTVEIADKVESVDETDTSPLPNQETVETDSINEPDTGSIGPVPGEGNSIKTEKDEAVNIEKTRQGLTNQQLHEKTRVSIRTIQDWVSKIQKGKEFTSSKYPDFFKQWRLNLTDSLWYEVD